MRRPVCVKCQVEFRVRKNGVTVIDTFSRPPKPYRLIRADLFECPICRTLIVGGFAQEPLVEHFEDNFEYWLQKATGGFWVYNYEYVEDAIGLHLYEAEVVEPLVPKEVAP